MNILFEWLEEPGVIKAIQLVYKIIEVIRIIVPIGLIVMIIFDITKKVINPTEKEGQKKIMIRLLAAIIVFFIPTFINIVFNIAGIDIKDSNINTNGSSSNIKTQNKESLSGLEILNCPDHSQRHLVGKKITLKTSIPESFKGDVKWTTENDSVFKLDNVSNKNETTIEILSRPAKGYSMVTVLASGYAKSCLIYIETVDKLEITNCPTITYHVKDKLSLQSNLPFNYIGTSVWDSMTSNNIFKIIPSTDGRSANVEILNIPQNNYAFISLNADGKSVTCRININ